MGLTLNVMAEIDSGLFEDCNFPALFCTTVKKCPPPFIDKYVFLNYLSTEAGFYPTICHSPDEFKQMFNMWVKMQHTRWKNLYNTMCFEYDPISNYDRTEEWTDNGTSDVNENGTSNSGETVNNELTRNSKVAAFDSDTQAGRDTQTESGKITSDASGSNSRTSNATHNNTRTGRAYGNIGVTTTQQMIEEERRVLMYDIMGVIVEEYKKRFCILIY